MARTASMTTQEAESLLGSRGSIRVDSTNRATVRKWLTAQGLPSGFVCGLSMTELGLAYNQTDGSGIAKIKDKLAESIKDGVFDPAESNESSNESTVIESKSNGHASNGATTDIESAIRAIAASVTPKAPTIDESMVRKIVADALAGVAPRVLEIRLPDKPAVTIEGRTHAEFETVLTAVSLNDPIMLVGPAGSGKSTIVEQVAKALGLTFFLEGAMDGAHKVLGFVDGHGRYQTTAFRQAFEHGGLFCWEEADNSDPAVPLTVNNAIANGHCTFPDSPVPVARHADFRIVACANTWGRGADRLYVGRNQLDGATIDRFAMTDIDYDESLEMEIAGNRDWTKRVQSLRHAAIAEKARIIISPRASIRGAKYLAAGWPQKKVEEVCVWKGLDSELRHRIERRAV